MGCYQHQRKTGGEEEQEVQTSNEGEGTVVDYNLFLKLKSPNLVNIRVCLANYKNKYIYFPCLMLVWNP